MPRFSSVDGTNEMEGAVQNHCKAGYFDALAHRGTRKIHRFNGIGAFASSSKFVPGFAASRARELD